MGTSYDPSKRFFYYYELPPLPPDSDERKKFLLLRGANSKIDQMKYCLERIKIIRQESDDGEGIHFNDKEIIMMNTYIDGFLTFSRSSLDFAYSAYYFHESGKHQRTSFNRFIINLEKYKDEISNNDYIYWQKIKSQLESDDLNWTKALMGRKSSLRDLTTHKKSLKVNPISDSDGNYYINLETNVSFEEEEYRFVINTNLIEYLDNIEEEVLSVLSFFREKLNPKN